MSEQTASTFPAPKRRWRRAIRILGLCAVLVVVLIMAAPWIVAHTRLRDTAINAILASPSVTAESDSASFGWVSPLSIQGLHLRSTNSHVDIRVDDLTTERSPYQLWSSAPDLGTIKAKKPHVILKWPLDVHIEQRHHRLEPTFAAIVEDAALTVRLTGKDEPAIDVDGINMTLRVEKAPEGRVLTLDPMVV